MIRKSLLILPALAIATMPLSANESSGRLGTLPLGSYTCALPGDAGGVAWRELPEKAFSIDNASIYKTANGSGTYLLTGKMVTFTRGPMKGMKFERSGTATLRWIEEDGSLGRIRCVRSSSVS
ncbi:MAG: elongation factor P [Pontixanthobacter sp.]